MTKEEKSVRVIGQCLFNFTVVKYKTYFLFVCNSQHKPIECVLEMTTLSHFDFMSYD